jgi:esterase/lipase superfamily enzyme
MLKKIFIFISLMFLSNCATSPTAFLGPVFTGAKTGSVYQASLSYGSNRIINKIREFDQNQSLTKKYNNFNISTFNRNPVNVGDYKVSHIHSNKITEKLLP